MAEDEEAPQEQAQETPEEVPRKRPRKRRVGGRVSLYPLSFEEAVEGLLQVKLDAGEEGDGKRSKNDAPSDDSTDRKAP